jgi:lisH domain-containing protein FOPNL
MYQVVFFNFLKTCFYFKFPDIVLTADKTFSCSTMCGTNANDMLAFALRETLERNGALDDIKTEIRMIVIRCINQCLPSSTNGEAPTLPSQPIENVLINEMVAEYLSFNGYVTTLSMFVAECQTSESDRLGEYFIRAELGLERPNEGGLALLYEIVEAMRSRRSS